MYQKGVEMSFNAREEGTVTEGLRKGNLPPRRSGAGDREEIVVGESEGAGWSII